MTLDDAIEELTDQAERWDETSEWHAEGNMRPFHDGQINVTTKTLHAMWIVVKHLKAIPVKPDADGMSNDEQLLDLVHSFRADLGAATRMIDAMDRRLIALEAKGCTQWCGKVKAVELGTPWWANKDGWLCDSPECAGLEVPSTCHPKCGGSVCWEGCTGLRGALGPHFCSVQCDDLGRPCHPLEVR